VNKTTEALKLAEKYLTWLCDPEQRGIDLPITGTEALAAIREALAEPVNRPTFKLTTGSAVYAAEPVKQEPPLDAWADEQQEWAKLDGTTAFHLIERHAEDWAETGAMMEAWLLAKSQTIRAEALEEAAKVCEDFVWYGDDIAAAIRGLK
jgi:hypothetical protein